VQTPAEQTLPAAQTVVQLPQCCGSVCVLVQKAVVPEPQAFGVEAGQPQTPFVQVWPAGHRTPQPPQLLASLVVEAQ
jgi:hypothetical protein